MRISQYNRTITCECITDNIVKNIYLSLEISSCPISCVFGESVPKSRLQPAHNSCMCTMKIYDLETFSLQSQKTSDLRNIP